MFSFWDMLLIPIGLVVLGYTYTVWDSGYFKRRGVKSLPYYPFVGHMLGVMRQKEHFKDILTQAYKSFPQEKYVGVCQFTTPILMIKDLDILKQMTIKDFDYFQDHLGAVDDKIDPIFGNMLLAMKGQKWREMRTTLSPAFTSSKIRNMFEFVVKCGEQMADYFCVESQKLGNQGYLEVEMKDAFTRYTNDVIATSAFGIKVDSLKEKDNEFYSMGKEATDFSGAVSAMKMFFIIIFPELSKILSLKILTKKTSDFFRRLVLGSMKSREEKHIVRPDMIHLLMKARRGMLKHNRSNDTDADGGFATVHESDLGKETTKIIWSDDEIVAQAMIFFLAGFETSSTLLSFMALELVTHPNIQRRLQEEIDQVLVDTKGKVDYTQLNTMKYMDMVVSETLRYWPPTVLMDRKCVKPYTLPPPSSSGKPYELKVGDGIWIPMMDIHHDPQHFKDPDVFDPERFSDENKISIKPLSYMPFGVGPRNCIGSRFALMESKAVMFHLLAKFDFIKVSKTQIPIKLKINTFALLAENGFWVGLKPRNT